MNRSDATPLHFFLTGERTYNESIVDECMIDEYCYIHEWECDDIVKDQFTDEAGSLFSLLIYVAGLLIGELEYEETEPGVFFISFVPSSVGLCELNAVFKIRRDVAATPITLPALNTWVNDAQPGTSWNTGTNPDVTRSIIGSSKGLVANYAFIEGVTYTILATFTGVGTNSCVLAFSALDSLGNVQFSGGANITGNETEVVELTFVALADTASLRASAVWSINGQSETITFDSITGTQAVGANQIMATTDEIRFSNDIACNKKVEFKSIKNFAGLVYDEYSEYFQMRIPGVFFHQRNPTDQKSLQISNSRVINTSLVLRKQKKFDIQDTTDYMHTKIQLIFAHAVSGSLLIDGVEWTIEEAYNQDDSTPDSYPLKRANIYLSRKNYVKRNVI